MPQQVTTSLICGFRCGRPLSRALSWTTVCLQVSVLRLSLVSILETKSAVFDATRNHNQSAASLRGVASLNVAVAHFFAAFLPSLLHKNYPDIFPDGRNEGVVHSILQSPLATVFFNGHFAVLVFFVLSGYVLALPYYANQGEKIKKRFWARYIRLNFPVAMSIILSYCLFSLGLYYNHQVSEVTGSRWFGEYFPSGNAMDGFQLLAIISYRQIISGDSILNPPLWSLRIEFIGSLLLLAYYSLKPRRSEFITLPLMLLLLWLFFGEDSIFYLAIFLGGILGSFHIDSRTTLLFFFLVGVFCGGFQIESAVYDWLPDVVIWDKKSFYNAVGAFFLCAAIINGLFIRLFSCSYLLFLGRISFPLYLVHFLMLCSMSSFIYVSLPNNGLMLSLNFVIYLAMCMLLALFMEKYIDRPSIVLSHKFSKFLFAHERRVNSNS